jgi:hypothetical protein
MQIVKARDVSGARNSYLEMLGRSGVSLPPMSEIFVETVYDGRPGSDTWLCYYALPGQRAA